MKNRVSTKSLAVSWVLILLFLWAIPDPLWAQDPGQPDTVFLVAVEPSIDDSLGGAVRVEVWLKTDNTGIDSAVAGISVPLIINTSNPNSNPVLDTTIATTFEGSDIASWDQLVHNPQVPPDSFPMVTVVGGVNFDSAGVTAGEYLVATLVFDLEKTTTLEFDTITISAGVTVLQLSTTLGVDYTPFWQETDVVVPGYPTRQPPIFVRAHSPVNLIVTDPAGDSIGVDFNTLDSAFYTAANDSIAIYKSLEGEYLIKVVWDPLDQSGESTYSVTARIDGTVDEPIASNLPVPDSGEFSEMQITNDPDNLGCLAKPGDANASDSYSLSDAISIVNYVFIKPGCSPLPSCWLTSLLCRGDWDGSGTVSLGDVIRAVNFVFNKPGGPWNAVPVGVCCL